MRGKLNLVNVLNELALVTSADSLAARFGLREGAGGGRFPNVELLEPATVATWAASCGWMALGVLRGDSSSPVDWLRGAAEGLRHMLEAQHASGLIDLYSCNYESAPDTAFVVQRLCPMLQLAIESGAPARDADWGEVVDLALTFVRRAVPGMLTGGFHTPNHRWVISSALVCAHHLLPDVDVAHTVSQYLAERLDLDEDGAWIEHSVGVYDAVCDRSMLLMAERMELPAALDAARRNLIFDYHMLNADGTAETGLSRRQDYGTRNVPLGLAGPSLQCGKMTGDLMLQGVAEFLWDRASQPGTDALNWLAYALLRYGAPESDASEHVPDAYVLHYQENGIWRVRDGQLSVTAFTQSTRLLGLSYGQAELRSVKISQSYFGVGRFVGESLEVHEGGATLSFSGQTDRHRPGYDLALGQPVSPKEWGAMRAARAYRALPPCAADLAIDRIDRGVTLRYVTCSGLPGVTGQIALDFAPGGVWETADCCLQPEPDQILFLKQGYGAMRYGDAVITVGPGLDAHRIWALRDAEPANGLVRVLLTFVTPVEHVLTIVVHGLA